MMRHPIRNAFLAVALASAAGVGAAATKPYQVTDTGTVAGAGSFMQAFAFATASTYDASKGTIYVAGLDSLFSNLKMDIQTIAGKDLTGFLAGTNASGTWNSTFSDRLSSVNLAPGTSYKLLVSGDAKVGGAQFSVTGAYLEKGSHFTAVPVPEPETYAMLLAGLGMMGSIARRRMKNR